MHDTVQALQGGVLIGLASWILFAGAGRISGVSSIVSGVLTTRRQSSAWRWWFLFGLAGGGALFSWVLQIPQVPMRSALILIPAGFLVGFGTVLGSGCTSGHGVCGLGRRSPRSLVAVVVFMGTAITTVAIVSAIQSSGWWESVLFDGMLRLSQR
ncbi:MAG: YeeE/YedE family protein [Burkholderiaceae bacterium]